MRAPGLQRLIYLGATRMGLVERVCGPICPFRNAGIRFRRGTPGNTGYSGAPLANMASLSRKTTWACALLLCSANATAQDGQFLRSEQATVSFVSDAPMERIEARTGQASAMLDITERSFAVQIPVGTFEGFNSPLQREHFMENYMQRSVHPNAVFKGRIIEAVDLTKPGTYRVRAKGDLLVHGVQRERIIECVLVVREDGVTVDSTFEIELAEHGIRIPRVVQQKVSPRVQVTVAIAFTPTAKRRR